MEALKDTLRYFANRHIYYFDEQLSMKGQTEIIVFVLLFIVGVSLFMSAIIWSRGIVDRNSDVVQLNSAEVFMKNLDSQIQSVISFGGQDQIVYNIDAPIELIGSNIIEIQSQLSVNIPNQWISLKENGSIIRETMQRGLFRIQLYYPEGGDYEVELYTEGPRISTPNQVLIEKSVSSEPGIIRIKITFQ